MRLVDQRQQQHKLEVNCCCYRPQQISQLLPTTHSRSEINDNGYNDYQTLVAVVLCNKFAYCCNKIINCCNSYARIEYNTIVVVFMGSFEKQQASQLQRA